MPEEPATPHVLELARGSFDDVNRRDFDAMMERFVPEAVWDLTDWGIGTFEGVTAIRGFAEDWLGNREYYPAEADEILDLGGGLVFVAYRETGRPSGSEGRIDHRRAYVALTVDGKTVRMTSYLDPDEARAAAERLAKERA